MIKRYIFDLDGTLLTGDYQETDSFLRDMFGEQANDFIQNMTHILDRYEKAFPRYDYETLATYLKAKTGLPFTKDIIRDWDMMVEAVTDTKEEGVQETLEYLKSQDKSLVVLTNWFGRSQEQRLKRADLLQYFDTVYGGDVATKPHREAYWYAAAGRKPSECLCVGDNVDNDYIGPRACAMHSVLYDKNNNHHKSLVKIKSFEELKKIK